MNYVGVAISGKAGAGKNEFATHLQREFAQRGQWAVPVALADAVKAECLRLYGITKADPGGREKLVEVGHGMRQVCPDYWIRKLATTVDSLRPFGLIPLLTDLRYLNEYEWARDAGWLMVRVDATGMDRSAVLSMRGEDREFAWSDHASETELDDVEFDVRFWNPHGSLITLAAYARDVADLCDGTLERIAV